MPRSVRSGVAQLVGQAGKLVLFAGSGMVLARLLTPRDFGIFAMAMSFVALMSSVHTFGLSAAVVQRRDLEHGHLGPLFWLTVWLSMGVVAITTAGAPLVARFYREPAVTGVTITLGLGLLASALGMHHRSLLARQLRFDSLATIDVVAVAVSVVAGVAAALAGAGYWALALQFVVVAAVASAGYWWRVRWRPGWTGALTPGRGDLQPFVRYGWQLTVAKLVAHVGNNLDRVVVAYVHGSRPVGLYDNAFRWSHYPMLQVFPPLVQVGVSSLSRAREGAGRYAEGVRLALLPVLSLTLPALAFMAAESRLVILTLLGGQWVDTIPMFRWLCVAAFARALSAGTRWIYLAEGRTADHLRWTVFEAAVLVAAVVIGVGYGALGVAVAFTTGVCLTAGPAIAYCLRGSDLSPRDYLAVAWRPMFASLAAMAALTAFGEAFGQTTRVFSTLLLRLVPFLSLYALVWLALPGGRAEARRVSRLVSELARG